MIDFKLHLRRILIGIMPLSPIFLFIIYPNSLTRVLLSLELILFCSWLIGYTVDLILSLQKERIK